MAQSSRGARTRQSSRTGAIEVIMHPNRTRPGRFVGMLVRHRAELVLLTCVFVGFGWLSSTLPRWVSFAVLITVVLFIAGVTPVRRFVVRRYWCVVSRHRVRTCFRSTWTMTHDGSLPYLLWSRPTPVGERIRVWLPAGLCVQDLARVSDKLAAACWARECRVEPDPKHAASAVIHIVRRDPLENTSELVPDVLSGIDRIDEDTTTVVPLPDRSKVADVRPVAGQPSQSGSARTSKPKETRDEPVIGFDGMDVSDYVDL